jgi:hypothetical protein
LNLKIRQDKNLIAKMTLIPTDTFLKSKLLIPRKSFTTLFLLFVLTSCATYYQTNYSFNQEFEKGDLEHALSTLQSNSKEGKGRAEFLYFVNNGLVLSMLGRYEESNDYFEKAFLFGEDYRKNYLHEAASYLTNPAFTSYKGEDHEHLVLLYYKALNFLKLNKKAEALVECRRLDIRLQQLSDRYKSNDKFRNDAFVHNLMGIIYDSDGDYNNAFIAYRNAYEIYSTEYDKFFKIKIPDQLKLDLLRTAWLSGFTTEFNEYKRDFELPNYQYIAESGGDLVFFWHNGLSPIKVEWGINFAITRNNHWVTFSNPELGLNFPFNMESHDERDRRGLENLEIFRVAFPKYLERPTYYQSATINYENKSFQLELVEDINKVAFKVLDERMTLELSKALVRAALKKVAEYQVRKSDKALGSVIGLINAITEKADTRNWQTLPHSIYYSRIPLKEGKNAVTLRLNAATGRTMDYDFHYQVKKGETLFHTFSSLESSYPNYSYY